MTGAHRQSGTRLCAREHAPGRKDHRVSERPMVACLTVSASHGDEVSSLRDNIPFGIEQLQRIKAGAERSRPHHQHQLPMRPHQPGAHGAVDDCTNELPSALGGDERR